MTPNNETLSTLHDGRLFAVALEADGLTVSCSTVGGTKLSIAVGSIGDLCANNFRQGNIILFAGVIESIDDLGDPIVRALAETEQSEKLASYRERHRRLEAAERIRYFVVQSSYGCDLAVSFRGEISISKT